MSGKVQYADVEMGSDNEEEDFQGEEEEENVYEVESITDKKKVNGQWKYRVKWVGYPDEQSTWEPEENLDNVKKMLEEFEEKWRSKHQQENKDGLKKSVNMGPGRKKKDVSSSVALKESTLNKKTKKDDVNMFDDAQPKKKRRLEDGEFEVKNSSMKSSFAKPSKKENSESTARPSNGLPTASPYKGKMKANAEDPIILGGEDDSPRIYGSFDSRDLPKKLITARLSGSNNEVNCLVEWDLRKDGIKPTESFVSNKVLREKCPHLLLDFYESRLRFPAQNK